MKKVAVISAILECPECCQQEFNQIVSSFNHLVKGRMGIPFNESHMAIVSITVVGTMDEINHLTGRLGNIQNVTVKTAVSKKGLEEE